MRRRLLGGIVLLAAAVAAGWWFARPTPGDSLFADWQPRAKGKVWTITGSPGSSHLAFVDPTGAIQPRRETYSVHFLVFDRDKHRLYSPLLHNVRSRTAFLSGGHAPSIVWEADSLQCVEMVFASADTCYSELFIRDLSCQKRHVSVFAAAVPYMVTGGMQSGFDVKCDTASRSMEVDGKLFLSSDTEPSGAAATMSEPDTDITRYLRNGVLPRGEFVRGEFARVSSGAMRFDLILKSGKGTALHFAMPLTEVATDQVKPMQRAAFSRALTEVGTAWEERRGRIWLWVPDQRVMACFDASLEYLVMLSANGRTVPGPTKYNLFWVRDCAYMADALYYSGQQDLIPPALERLRAMQLPSGGFAPRLRAKDDELDAPGEVIYALVQQYRRTNDRKWLADRWPCILAACRYVRAKRGVGLGVLPPSVSAEDLGDKLQRHYWDDFWCIRGLHDAAFAAGALGKRDDAAWISAEAESLYSATRASIDATMARHSIGYIPNGPDEVISSSAARGTSCALWPCAVLDPSDALVRRSYDVYWRKWIAPSGGGFVHRGHYWPYAGLDLAQGYLMLGQRTRAWSILKWTLDHDPTHGFLAWPEGMSIEDLSLAEGDMPHGWVCAAYISLVRNMLVRESGRDLVLLSGVPNEWLKPGSEIAIRDFPTEFGKVSYRAEVSGDSLKLSLSGARPRGCYRVMLPGRSAVVAPSGAREITIRLSAAE